MSVSDGKGFRYTSTPDYYAFRPSQTEVIKEANRQRVGTTKETEPARDVRYPAFAGPMSDGRLVTDYRPKCSKNITVGAQFDTKLWMQHNAVNIIETSRRRHVEWTGASIPQPDLAPPPANAIRADADTVDVIDTGLPGGLGIQRANDYAPELFGTFSYMATPTELDNNKSRIMLTTFYEGGRNTPRGRVQLQAGNGQISRPGVFKETGVPSMKGANEAMLTGEPVLQ
jgi:hypothetical protein